jgi:hypothetical protein
MVIVAPCRRGGDVLFIHFINTRTLEHQQQQQCDVESAFVVE